MSAWQLADIHFTRFTPNGRQTAACLSRHSFYHCQTHPRSMTLRACALPRTGPMHLRQWLRPTSTATGRNSHGAISPMAAQTTACNRSAARAILPERPFHGAKRPERERRTARTGTQNGLNGNAKRAIRQVAGIQAVAQRHFSHGDFWPNQPPSTATPGSSRS